MCDQDAINQYTDNLVNFISDIRKQVGIRDLPFVFGELGNGGPAEDGSMKRFRDAQAAVAAKGIKNVSYVETTDFARSRKTRRTKAMGTTGTGMQKATFYSGMRWANPWSNF